MPYRILAIIPARSGSRGLRNKNIRKLGGVPLLVHAVELAKKAQRRGESWRIIVSTDSAAYARLAKRAGAEIPSLRPKRLASDTGRVVDAVVHTLKQVEQPASPFDAVMMLSATTPLTQVADVRRAIARFGRAGGASVASVTADPVAASWRFKLQGNQLDRSPRRHHVGRRQEDRDAVVLNGAVYIATPAWLRRYKQFVRAGITEAIRMPPERSIDIDTALHLRIAECLSAAM